MDNYFFELLIGIIVTIIGAFIGPIIQKLLLNDTSTHHTYRQFNFTEIHIRQNNIISSPKDGNQNSTNANDNSSFILYIIGAFFLVRGYLMYEANIKLGILLIFMFLESMFIASAYVIVKNNCIDSKIRSILIFNILSLIIVPCLIYFLEYPLIPRTIDDKAMYEFIIKDGISVIFTQTNNFMSILYQVVGLLFLLFFLLSTILGCLHTLSMLNLSIDGNGFWRWIYKKTYIWCKSSFRYIITNIILLVLSFLMISGLLLEFVLSNASYTNF